MRTPLSWRLLLCVSLAGCASRNALPAAAPTAAAPSAAAPSAASIATARDNFVRLGGTTLRYRELGTGEPVMLIHGYSGDLSVWSGVGDSLARDHRVVVMDLRGFGKSTKFGTPAEFGTRMADDVIKLADELGIVRAHLVGHSMGAVVAANVAARYPRRVSSVSLVAGPFYQDSATFAREVSPWEAELRAGRGIAALGQWLFPGMDSATARRTSDDAMARNDLGSLIAVLPSLAALVVPLEREPPVPILIAVGGGDPLNQQSRDLARRWPSARLLEMPSANHMSVLAKPELLAALRAITRSPRAR